MHFPAGLVLRACSHPSVSRISLPHYLPSRIPHCTSAPVHLSLPAPLAALEAGWGRLNTEGIERLERLLDTGFDTKSIPFKQAETMVRRRGLAAAMRLRVSDSPKNRRRRWWTDPHNCSVRCVGSLSAPAPVSAVLSVRPPTALSYDSSALLFSRAPLPPLPRFLPLQALYHVVYTMSTQKAPHNWSEQLYTRCVWLYSALRPWLGLSGLCGQMLAPFCVLLVTEET
jgi:hypothetical protein